jgi:hypothetical protein
MSNDKDILLTDSRPIFTCISKTIEDILNELHIESEPDYSDIMRDTLYDTHDRKILFSRGI